MIFVPAALGQFPMDGLGVTALECAGTWWAFHHTGHSMSPGWGLVKPVVSLVIPHDSSVDWRRGRKGPGLASHVLGLYLDQSSKWEPKERILIVVSL